MWWCVFGITPVLSYHNTRAPGLCEFSWRKGSRVDDIAIHPRKITSSLSRSARMCGGRGRKSLLFFFLAVFLCLLYQESPGWMSKWKAFLVLGFLWPTLLVILDLLARYQQLRVRGSRKHFATDRIFNSFCVLFLLVFHGIRREWQEHVCFLWASSFN